MLCPMLFVWAIVFDPLEGIVLPIFVFANSVNINPKPKLTCLLPIPVHFLPQILQNRALLRHPPKICNNWHCQYLLFASFHFVFMLAGGFITKEYLPNSILTLFHPRQLSFFQEVTIATFWTCRTDLGASKTCL